MGLAGRGRSRRRCCCSCRCHCRCRGLPRPGRKGDDAAVAADPVRAAAVGAGAGPGGGGTDAAVAADPAHAAAAGDDPRRRETDAAVAADPVLAVAAAAAPDGAVTVGAAGVLLGDQTCSRPPGLDVGLRVQGPRHDRFPAAAAERAGRAVGRAAVAAAAAHRPPDASIGSPSCVWGSSSV